jgi:PASTA domain-containing protein
MRSVQGAVATWSYFKQVGTRSLSLPVLTSYETNGHVRLRRSSRRTRCVERGKEFIVSATRQVLLVFKRVFIVIGIAIAFTLGLLGAIYLSLRSSETRVPDIVGKDRMAAENTISDAGLNFRVRATRATAEAKPDTVLIQLPHAGEIVKVGQTVAVDISRATSNGESSTPTPSDMNTNTTVENNNDNRNTNSDDNANDNKPKKKPANKNANDNSNSTANRNQNRNANRATTNNANANRMVTPPAGNTNLPGANRTPRNVNTNRRPPVAAPTP